MVFSSPQPSPTSLQASWNLQRSEPLTETRVYRGTQDALTQKTIQ